MSRILVVDDDKKILEIINEVLLREGYDIETKEYIENITIEEFEGFDLILLDVMLPVFDGFEILKKIKPEDQVNARQRILSVLDMRKMFPVDDTVYTEVKFNISSSGSRSDNQRTFLMIKEYNFLNDISEDIARKATKIYEKQIQKNKVLPYHCDYRKLEQALAEYKKDEKTD